MKVGLSSDFIACAFEFVAGRTVAPCLPTPEEQDEIVRLHEKHLIARGAKIEREAGKMTIEWPPIELG